MRLYGAILGGEPGVAVPGPMAELSTKRLLTMTWLDGAPILDTAKAPTARRNEVALRMFRIWYVPFYHYGVIHGDPHLGNYTVAPNDTVNLLDFGCVRVFRASFVRRRHRPLSRARARRPRPRGQRLPALGLWRAVERDDRRAEPLGALRLRAAARRPRAAHSGKGERPRWRGGGRERAPRHPPAGRGAAAARIRLYGPRRGRARLGVSAPEGRDQLAPAVPRIDRGFRRGRPRPAPARGARSRRGAAPHGTGEPAGGARRGRARRAPVASGRTTRRRA